MIVEKEINIGGSMIYYKLAGDRKNKSLIFLHGWPGNENRNSTVLQELEKHFYVIAPEHPGLLRSQPLQDYTNIFYQYGDVVYQILLQENFSKQQHIIWGQSFGGAVASSFAEKYQEIIRALILTDSIMGGQKQDLFRKILLKHGKKIIKLHLHLPNFIKKHGLKTAFGLNINNIDRKKTKLNQLIRSRVDMINNYCYISRNAHRHRINLLDKNYSPDLPIIMLRGDRDGEERNIYGYSKARDAQKLYNKFMVEGRKVSFLLAKGGHTVLYTDTEATIQSVKKALSEYIEI